MERTWEEKMDSALHAYFEEGLEPEEIAQRLGLNYAEMAALLGDKERLEPYRKRSEAAKLRAQICVNESAEAAARQQARLLRQSGVSETVTQRAAKDILDRAGVRMPKEEKRDVTVTFIHGAPALGMPARYEEDA